MTFIDVVRSHRVIEGARRHRVILSLSNDGPGSPVARYATIVAGAGLCIVSPSFDRLRMTP